MLRRTTIVHSGMRVLWFSLTVNIGARDSLYIRCCWGCNRTAGTRIFSFTFTSFALSGRKKGRTVFCIVIIALVSFSRMYLGVHTPLDVGVSLVLGVLISALLYPLFKTEERMERSMPYILAVSALFAIGFVLYTFLLPEEGLDVHNLESGRKNACTMLGCIAGLFPVYIIDRKILRYPTAARWYAQIIKVLVGFGIVLLIKSTLQAPLEWVFGGSMYVARTVRYHLIVLFAGLLWPLTFRRFAALQIPCLDCFGDWVTEKLSRIFGKKESKS